MGGWVGLINLFNAYIFFRAVYVYVLLWMSSVMKEEEHYYPYSHLFFYRRTETRSLRTRAGGIVACVVGR